MDLEEIQDFIAEEIDEEDANIGLDLLIAMAGKFSEGRMALDAHGIDGDDRAEVLGDVLAAMVTIIAHTAEEEGVDLAAAMDERMDAMRAEKEQREDVEQMIEDADYEGLAEAMGLTAEADDEETRAFI